MRTRDTSNNHMIGIHIRHGTLAIESVIEFGTEKSLPETAVENCPPQVRILARITFTPIINESFAQY